MTKPPCGNGTEDCPRRYVGCKSECEEWHEWLAIHEHELEQIRAQRHENQEYYEYSADVIKKYERHKSRKVLGQR